MRGARCGTRSRISRITPWAEQALNHWATWDPFLFYFYFYLFYLFFIFFFSFNDSHREREAETQTEVEAGSMQEARCGPWSWGSRITPWAEQALNRWATQGSLSQIFKKGTNTSSTESLLENRRERSTFQFTVQIYYYSDNKTTTLIPYHPPS